MDPSHVTPCIILKFGKWVTLVNMIVLTWKLIYVSYVLIIHNITAKAALKFGSEAWVLKKREKQRLEAAQMKFLRHLLGITKLDKEKDQCIREKTGAQNIVKEIKQYQKKWLQHVQRMDTNRIPKQALRYRPKGRRNIGRPKKRWRDQLHFEDQGTGKTPSPSETWWWWWWWSLASTSNTLPDDGVTSLMHQLVNKKLWKYLLTCSLLAVWQHAMIFIQTLSSECFYLSVLGWFVSM